MASVRDAINREAAADGQTPDMGLGSIFQDPNWIGKLATNPKTAAYLGDQAFMEKLVQCAKNPSRMNEELRDPRMMQVIAVLLGLNIEMPGGAGPSASGGSEDTPVSLCNPRCLNQSQYSNNAQMPDAPSPPKKTSPPPKEPTPEPEEEDEEAKEAKENKAKADQEKVLGTEKYKKRQFDEAIEHYTNAWNLYKDITYLTNRAAAKFEKSDYEGCIEDCKLAIEEGRNMMADFKLIAK